MEHTGVKIWRILLPLGVDLLVGYICVAVVAVVRSGQSVGSVLERLWAGNGVLYPDDLAWATILSALLVLPVFWIMWRHDVQNRKNASIQHQIMATMILSGKTAAARGKNRKADPIKWNVAAFAAGMLGSGIIGYVMNAANVTQIFSNQIQEELLAAGVLLQLLGYCLIVPAAEELLYRGLVYGRLKELMNRQAAIIVAALLFALAHGNWLQGLYAFPMALVMHWFYGKTDMLLTPFFFHIGANLLSVLYGFMQ